MQKRICPICGELFTPKTKKHIFCKRKCYKISYRKQKNIQNFPKFICPQCKTKIELNFHPKNNNSAWEKFQCPICNYNPSKDKKTEIRTIIKKD